jgi:hypothetical protein
MTAGHVLPSELHGRDSGHIGYHLCAIQRGDPEPEVFTISRPAAFISLNNGV